MERRFGRAHNMHVCCKVVLQQRSAIQELAWRADGTKLAASTSANSAGHVITVLLPELAQVQLHKHGHWP